MRLFRPVGQKELVLIRDSGWRAFPPRLPEQPIFYPVLNYEYACQIATKWNTTHGVVTFEIEDEYIDGFDVNTVGSSIHQEYWIPAEALCEFNSHIIGLIELVKVSEDESI